MHLLRATMVVAAGRSVWDERKMGVRRENNGHGPSWEWIFEAAAMEWALLVSSLLDNFC